jgi:hypothetical protein
MTWASSRLRLLSRRNSERASEELHGGNAWARAGTTAERAPGPQLGQRDSNVDARRANGLQTSLLASDDTGRHERTPGTAKSLQTMTCRDRPSQTVIALPVQDDLAFRPTMRAHRSPANRR